MIFFFSVLTSLADHFQKGFLFFGAASVPLYCGLLESQLQRKQCTLALAALKAHSGLRMPDLQPAFLLFAEKYCSR